MKIYYCVLLLSILLFARCSREHGEAPDTAPPVIILSSPANNQAFRLGQSIVITADVADQSKIEEIHLEIINATTGDFIVHEHFAPDSPVYKLSSNFTASTAAAYNVKVEAVDARGNNAETEVRVVVN